MPNELPLINIKPTSQFKRDLRDLSKKYRHIRSDVQSILERLQTGELMGDRIPKTGYEVFKVRIKNSDIQKGKSAGYRLIYYLESSHSIVLMSIYFKSENPDISLEEIAKILTDFNKITQDTEETQN
jgi:mRNA-degrading endonuclease RelE of RelBE toxin-antitoxin system